jgi:hypothetical protein
MARLAVLMALLAPQLALGHDVLLQPSKARRWCG